MQARSLRMLPPVLILAVGALLPADQPTGPPHLQIVESLITSIPEHSWRIEQPFLVRSLYYDIIDLTPASDQLLVICHGLWVSYIFTFYRDGDVLLRAIWSTSCGDQYLHLESGLTLLPDQLFLTLLHQVIGEWG